MLVLSLMSLPFLRSLLANIVLPQVDELFCFLDILPYNMMLLLDIYLSRMFVLA